MIIKNGKVFIDGKYHEGLDIRCADNKIMEIGADLSGDDQVIDAEGNLVFAGFIDTHNHGGFGHSFHDGEEAVREMLKLLPSAGVTSVLPTLVPSSADDGLTTTRIIRKIRENQDGADPFAFHFEGPYFNNERHASMNPLHQANPTKEHTLYMVDNDLSDIWLFNTAPELPGAMEWIKWITGEGVRVEVCYTIANSDIIKEAADNGATQISHLYNGFEALNQRVSGPVVGCLLEDRLNAQLNCDGIHVAKGWIRLAMKAKGIDHVYGITDSCQYAGMPQGKYNNEEFGDYYIKEDRVIDHKGMLIAGAAPWDVVMRGAKNKVGLNLEEIGIIFGENPAKCLGITDRGKIEVGRRADFTIMDSELNVLKTIIKQKVYYQSN